MTDALALRYLDAPSIFPPLSDHKWQGPLKRPSGPNVLEHLYVASSEWGGFKGGINVFNKSIVEGLARMVGASVQVCAVIGSIDTLPTGPSAAFRFLSYDGTSEGLAATIGKDIDAAQTTVDRIVILGHDVHTGPHALGARDALLAKGLSIVAGVFCHMDYSAYQKFKYQPIEQIAEKVELQRSIIRNADHVYGVGPLLYEAFKALRGSSGSRSTIHQVLPGVPHELSNRRAENPAKAINFFFAGRIDPDNDPIKNGRLALHAICDAYARNARSSEPRWQQRGQFIAYGLGQDVTESWFYEELKGRSYRDHFTPMPRSFADQKTIFAELLNSHIAIMPSIHEGFGLAGWEALCAGVPLICSRHSGLANFLDAYFKDNHHVPSESVIFVGMGNDEDVDIISSAIEDMVRVYDRRQSHALKLAEYITRQFTWDSCAQSVARSLGLAQAGPQDWQSRQHDSDAALARDGASEAIAAEVERALREARAANSLAEWSLTCTALNYISDIGKTPTYAVRQNAFGQLEAIADGIANSYASSCSSEPLIRCSGRFDVAWRFMAAASGVSGSFQDFLKIIPERMFHDIKGDSFLHRELLQYTMKFSDEFENVSEEIARDFFAQILKDASRSAALQVRFARLQAAFPVLGFVAALDPLENPFYTVERDRCEVVKGSRFDLNDLANDHRLGPSALALATLSPDYRKRGIDQIFAAGMEHGYVEPLPAWRGDKLLRTALLAAIIPPKTLIAFTESLAQDEDEAIRWAAIDLAFSPTMRTRLFDASLAGALQGSPSQLKERLGAIVDSAVEIDGCHPWMQREFLDRFHREHNAPVVAKEMRFTASDFPVSRSLFGPAVGEAGTWRFARLHPEVHISSQKLLETMRRILMVMPPISLEIGAPDVSMTSTPPLGLGMVGSHLLAEGHDVHLADCHRTPAMTQQVIESASQFQWIGFNTVLPTMRSTLGIASLMKKAFPSPAIVVGGPAVNGGAFRNAAQNDDEATCWDFEIRSQAEKNFAYLVGSAARREANLPTGIEPNERSSLVLGAGHRSNRVSPNPEARAWPEPILLDRRLFSTRKGQYEPQPTRAIGSTAVEAHIVMSRGCDWNCTFCTERRDQSGGERRRGLASIQHELSELARRYEDLRIQFIDDNLLPQIGVLTSGDRVARAKALSWTEEFLSMLKNIKSDRPDKFGWRGIFRVEDFFAYERELSDFIVNLRASGCRMLAFGVEHGDEAKRSKMKAGPSASNSEFKALFQRLRDAGIHSKAYFILGGPRETLDTAEETIRFAVESGASLAYFALYKEFVPALKALRKVQVGGSNSHSSYSQYDQLQIDWDATIGAANGNAEDVTLRAFVARIDPDQHHVEARALLTCYSELARIGFRFADLVKYSDHHSIVAPASEVLNKVNFNDQEAYEAKVAAAYIRFYMRPAFLEIYQSLLANGY